MKKLAISIILLCIYQISFSQGEYKTAMKNSPDSQIEIHVGANEVKILGHDKDEIIITTDFAGEYIDEPTGQRKEKPQRAAGLKPISVSASDNTGIGLVVDKSEGHFSVLKISQNARNKSYHFKIPNKAKLIINDMHAEINTTYKIFEMKDEIEINALNSDVQLQFVSGPIVANATNGNVEVVYSKMTPEKPNSILSVNGYVDVYLPKETAADLELHTVNGEAYTDWEIDIDEDASASLPMGGPNMNMFNLSGQINGGGIPISIQSVNGDIFLRKKK